MSPPSQGYAFWHGVHIQGGHNGHRPFEANYVSILNFFEYLKTQVAALHIYVAQPHLALVPPDSASITLIATLHPLHLRRYVESECNNIGRRLTWP